MLLARPYDNRIRTRKVSSGYYEISTAYIAYTLNPWRQPAVSYVCLSNPLYRPGICRPNTHRTDARITVMLIYTLAVASSEFGMGHRARIEEKIIYGDTPKSTERRQKSMRV